MSILILATIVSACGLLITACYALLRNSQDRKRVRENLGGNSMLYPTASAGTPTLEIPTEQASVSIKYTEFKDFQGNVINPEDYLQFVVKGDSMQFCGIHNNDLIFVRKGFQSKDLITFPTPVVIRRDKPAANETQYKVRRAWGACKIEECEEQIKNILTSDSFDVKISTIEIFDGKEALLEDFRQKRLPKYLEKYHKDKSFKEKYTNVIISTTFHTDEAKIRFSLHPLTDVVGIVTDSFTI